MITPPTFFAVEIEVYQPGLATFTYAQGHGTRTHGTLSVFPDRVQSVGTILASDMGYRTAPTDPGGVQPYVPIVSQAFQIDRKLNIDPTQSPVAAAWGAINLSNADHSFDPVVDSWNSDNRNVRIYYGVKGYEDFEGVRNGCTARRYYTDPPKASLAPAFFGVCQPWFLSETELQVPIRDATYFAEMPLQTQLYGGTGGYDGTPQLQGQPRPKARGGTAALPIRNVSPVLLDPARLIYQYSDAAGTVVKAYEGGAAVWTYAGDTTDLYSGSPAAGSYRTDNSRGLFQLGSNPQRTVTADVTGQFSGAGAVTSACQIARYLLTEELGVPVEHMNLPSFSLLAPDPGAGIAGVYWSTDSMPADGVTAAALLSSSFAGHVIPNRQGLLTLILIRDIPNTATALARFDTVNTVSMTPQALPDTVAPPAFRVRLAYGSNYTVMSSGVSPAADITQQQFVAGPGPSAVWVSQAVQQTWLRPNDIGILPSALLSLTDAQNVVNSLGALWGTRRRLFSVVVPVAIGLHRDLGDIVQLVWPADILVQGALGQIVGESWSSNDGVVTFLVLV